MNTNTLKAVKTTIHSHEKSEGFGVKADLGLVLSRVIAVPNYALSGAAQKKPHIGWDALQPSITVVDWRKIFLQDNQPCEAVYFVHSFMAAFIDPEHRIADRLYGSHKIAASIGRDQITGYHFHPEKGGEAGLKILRRFLL